MPADPTDRFSLKVLLYNIDPVIWRRFSIPATATFKDFHRALQDAMGWEDKHLHEFRHGKGKRLTNVIAADDPDVFKGDDFQEESTVTLASFVGRRSLPIRLLYRYDFTEDWVHEITIEEKSTGEKATTPLLLEGKRACPPEDCGGPEFFMDSLAGDLEFLDERYDPAVFDPKKVKFR
jgi:hypothetical protein